MNLFKAYQGINSKPIGEPIDRNDISPAESGPGLPNPLPSLHSKDKTPQGNVPPNTDLFIRNKKPGGSEIQGSSIERPSKIESSSGTQGRAGNTGGASDGNSGSGNFGETAPDGLGELVRNKNKYGSKISNDEVVA